MNEELISSEWWIDRLLDRSRDRIDEDGRPVGEVSSVHFAEVDTELGPCRYPDRRREVGLPMNLSALRQASRDWGDVLHVLAEAAGEKGAWTVGAVFEAMRCVVERAARQSAVAPLGRALSAARKVSIGFERVFADLWVHSGVGDAELDALFATPSAFFGYLDDAGWLVGQTQVCAGSRSMIEAAYHAVRTGAASSEPLERTVGDADLRAFWSIYALTRRASQLTREGYLGELPGYGERPDRIPYERWPVSALLATRNAHPAQLLARTAPPAEASLERVGQAVAARHAELEPLFARVREATSFAELDGVVRRVVVRGLRTEEGANVWNAVVGALRDSARP